MLFLNKHLVFVAQHSESRMLSMSCSYKTTQVLDCLDFIQNFSGPQNTHYCLKLEKHKKDLLLAG